MTSAPCAAWATTTDMSGPGVVLEAWLLHSRPFRDTSLLLDFLTLEQGRVSAIARGARTQKGRGRSTLQPFAPLRISLAGKHELRTLQSSEASAPSLSLQGERLFAGFYLNELLVRLLHGHEPEPTVFHAYTRTLGQLSVAGEVEPLLRQFELRLLDALGYGLQFEHDAESGEELQPEAWYYLQADSGFVRQLQTPASDVDAVRAGLFPGWALIRIADADFTGADTRRHAKRLLRQVLHQHLGGKELVSRQLFARAAQR
jgi:DNA repair protein RecO (recombination protein O)